MKPIKRTLSSGFPIPDFSDVQFDQVECFNENFLLPVVSMYDRIPRISASTLSILIRKKTIQYYIIDCRFNYEFEGGHIVGATNLTSASDFSRFFEENSTFSERSRSKRCAIIFHCEFSQSRAPTIAGLFRETDRELNRTRYPQLFYPDIFILQGGFKQFYSEFSDLCVGDYVRMLDSTKCQNGELAKSNNQFKKEIQNLKEANNLMKNSSNIDM